MYESKLDTEREKNLQRIEETQNQNQLPVRRKNYTNKEKSTIFR